MCHWYCTRINIGKWVYIVPEYLNQMGLDSDYDSHMCVSPPMQMKYCTKIQSCSAQYVSFLQHYIYICRDQWYSPINNSYEPYLVNHRHRTVNNIDHSYISKWMTVMNQICSNIIIFLYTPCSVVADGINWNLTLINIASSATLLLNQNEKDKEKICKFKGSLHYF